MSGAGGWLPAALTALVAILLVGCTGGAEPTGAQATGAPTGGPATTLGGLATAAPSSSPRTSLPPGAGDLGGKWSGMWADGTGGSTGSLDLDWRQEGTNLTGAITIDGWSCLIGGVVSGITNGKAVQFMLRQRDIQVTYRGTVAGPIMSGTYSTNCDDSGGTWRVAKNG